MPSHNRSSRNPLARLTRKQLIAIGAAIVVVVGGVVGGVVASSGGGPKKPRRVALGSTTSTLPAPTTTQPSLPRDVCPLTDEPAPGGKVPARAPLAVKIGNEPGPDAGGLGEARPQSGLDEADVVYDTPAEGGIYRYVAVYQCSNAAEIGPVRSYRWVDSQILAEFRHSILAHVGGIQPDLQALNAQPYIFNVDADCAAEPTCYSDDFIQLPSRVPPDSTYTSTSAAYATAKAAEYHTAPRPVFRYTPSLPAAATAVSSATINLSPGTTTVVWQWSPTDHAFLHYYDSTPDVDQLNQQQVSAANVFIQVVTYKIGPYEETAGIAGSGDVESQTVGSGSGYLLRNGKVLPVTWHRAALQDPTTFTDAAGKQVGLAAGRTWVEMILDTYAKQKDAVTFTR